MRSAAGAFALLSILGLGNESVNFDGVKPGVPPPNWTFVSVLGSPRPRWEVRYDPSAPSRGNVLERLGSGAPEKTGGGAAEKNGGGASEPESPVAVFDKVVCRDGELSVKFKIDARGKGRRAGVIWRYQDPSNYYLLRFSADEKNVGVFRVRDGHSEALQVRAEGGRAAGPAGTLIPHDIQLGQWYLAKVVFRGDRIRVLLGNRKLLEAFDSGMTSAGKAGVWTHGRTTVSFDDFKIDKRS